jgi:DNA-binding NarL/FixJ family response regulator
MEVDPADEPHTPTRIMLVEDEPELLRRFSEVLASEPRFCLAGAVTTAASAMALLTELAPDVVLVDLGLPDIDGVQLIRHIKRHSTKQVEVLVVTMFGDDEHVLSSIEAGASGYLLKDGNTDAILTGIGIVLAGGAAITPTIARKILRRMCSGSDSTTAPPAAGAVTLTQREIETLQLVAKGLTNNEIAASLKISIHTVVTHFKKIYSKLGVHSRSEAVYEAGQLGIL